MILLVLLVAFTARARERASVDSFTRPRYLVSLHQFTPSVHCLNSQTQFIPSIPSIHTLESFPQFVPSIHTINSFPQYIPSMPFHQFTHPIHTLRGSLGVVNRRFPGDRPRARFDHPCRVFGKVLPAPRGRQHLPKNATGVVKTSPWAVAGKSTVHYPQGAPEGVNWVCELMERH